MADAFSITTASGTIELDANRQGSASFSVSNVSGKPLRARADVVAEAVAPEARVAEPVGAGPGERATRAPAPPPPAAGWFAIEGQAERSFPVGGTEVYRVDVAVPAAAAPPPDGPPRTYRFRLDVLGTDNPDEDQAQGQWVEFAVRPQAPPPRRVPWLWIIIAAAAALVVVAAVVVTFEVLSHRQGTLTPNANTVNFGVVGISATATQAVTVKNTGPVATTVNAAVSGTNATDFSLGTAACLGHTLAPNASCTFNVTFKPPAKGNDVASLQLTGDHAATKVVALTGTGGQAVATASPFTFQQSIQTGIQLIGTTTITNTGNAPLLVSSASITQNFAIWAISQDTCLGRSVAPNQQCTISVTVSITVLPFSPSATLVIGSNASNNPLSLPFTG